MFLRVCHAVQVGNDRIMIRSTDTCCADVGLWITMDTGMLLCNIPAYLVYANLGPDQIKALTSLYTFNGCDTTFCFSVRVKKILLQNLFNSETFLPGTSNSPQRKIRAVSAMCEQ